MPNWCNNSVTFTHKDRAQIDRVIEACKTGLFSKFMPCPQELRDTMAGSYGDGNPEKDPHERKEKENLAKHGHRNWYDWQCAMWGTKWDVANDRGNDDRITINDLGHVAGDMYAVTLDFDTAWSPPISFYEYMADAEGFHIQAYYYEPGVGFCGCVEGDADGLLDNYFDIPAKAAQVENEIPAAIDKAFGISENMDMWEQEQAEWEEERRKEAHDAAADAKPC
jgi:hypothetical protein